MPAQSVPLLRQLWRNTIIYPRYWRRAQLWVASILDPLFGWGSILDGFRLPLQGQALKLVGGLEDGSYVIPEHTRSRVLMSPGVGYSSKFERALAEQGMTVFLADASVSAPAESHDSFHFTKRFVGLGRSHITFDSWLNSSRVEDESFVVQMDIEGAEWRALSPKSLSNDNLLRVEWIALELHELETLFTISLKGLKRRRVLRRLLASHSVVFSRPNNCGGSFLFTGRPVPSLLEATFVRKDLVQLTQASSTSIPTFSNCEQLPAVPWPS
jgi:hypothetical protein